MRFRVNIEPTEAGEWVAECDAMDAQGRGLSPTAALDRLRDEIRYRMELCPCSGIDEDAIQFDLEA
jgi:hypothetical protein